MLLLNLMKTNTPLLKTYLGIISTTIYQAYVQQFGLLHLDLELARFCPDTKKHKELLETYNACVWRNGQQENGWGDVHFKDKNN